MDISLDRCWLYQPYGIHSILGRSVLRCIEGGLELDNMVNAGILNYWLYVINLLMSSISVRYTLKTSGSQPRPYTQGKDSQYTTSLVGSDLLTYLQSGPNRPGKLGCSNVWEIGEGHYYHPALRRENARLSGYKASPGREPSLDKLPAVSLDIAGQGANNLVFWDALE